MPPPASPLPTPSESEVAALEERLRRAMLAADVDALDALIADELRFTTQTGETIGKARDLDEHRSGRLRLTGLDPAGRRILTAPGVAAVAAHVAVAGAYAGEPFAGTVRYTRVWRPVGGAWRVVTGRMRAIAAPATGGSSVPT